MVYICPWGGFVPGVGSSWGGFVPGVRLSLGWVCPWGGSVLGWVCPVYVCLVYVCPVYVCRCTLLEVCAAPRNEVVGVKNCYFYEFYIF